jgi:hypothetical protein
VKRFSGSWTFLAVMPAMAVLAVTSAAQAQTQWEASDVGWCEEEWGGRDTDRFCEVLTARIAATGRLEVDAGQNGGVKIDGWTDAGVQIRAKVWANASSEERAQEIARAVRVRAEGGRIRAEGPETGRRENWGVTYEILTPRGTDLDIRTNNGGIEVTDVAGDIGFEATNGGVHLTRVGGDVRGETQNGGLHIELDGDRWAGEGLDVETTNGGIELVLPEGFSAELEAGTVNGGLDIDFPVTVQGRIGRTLTTTLGEGGPRIRAFTTNGGVSIVRR